jgi:hypothetical protein
MSHDASATATFHYRIHAARYRAKQAGIRQQIPAGPTKDRSETFAGEHHEASGS